MGRGVKLLLDTHALIWWLAEDPSLGHDARHAISDGNNDVLVSAATAMEVTTKYRLGKLGQATKLAHGFEAIIAEEGFASLPITVRHAVFAGGLRVAHKDPFDRFLIAQAMLEAAVLVSNEVVFDAFGVARIW